jgi:hypothetical protein
MVLRFGFKRGVRLRDESSRRATPLPRLVRELWFFRWVLRILWLVGGFPRLTWVPRIERWFARFQWRLVGFAWIERWFMGFARL